ncbi:hypothetical protein GTZ99_08695 [Novosphingobium sp. FSY-8]|uniref:Antibiotic biosynthesis monooxygenase n=1 Tax=Novosphingobium ovatum TaxID=1908523 RepID=A0ABW9XDM3_9SPHN|nr:hypothetical protein [Novosphingobium ovatum]NBC36634.1 hypothetical protein [Novosphingobium ovatum]
MITRTAIFEGRVTPGKEEDFFGAVESRLAPMWADFPGACNVRWFRVNDADADAAPIAMIQQVDYPSRAALAAAIASPQRDRARALTLELMQMFEGRFYHLISGQDELVNT